MSDQTTDRQARVGGPSLVGRAILALALAVIFHLFALAFAAALIGIPVAQYASGGGFPIFIAVLMIAAGACILFALVPRRAKVGEHGPELTREGQPHLFRVVEEVADAVGHPMPDAIHLDADINAGVLEEGAPLLPKRKVMVLGLPLVEVLTVDQLRGVIAHELAHYAGGDTRVNLWVVRTRMAVGRTLDALHWDEEDPGWFERLVRWPFELYGRLFLRITAAISRREEYAADAVAAQVAGRDAQVGALRRIAAGSAAFDAYWDQELAPLLERGVRPPVGEGFRRFLSAETIDRDVQVVLGRRLERSKHDPYDSHPTLAQRLEALGAGPHDDPQDGSGPAVELLLDRDGLELQLLTALGGDAARELEPIGWDETERVWKAGYAQMVEDLGDTLMGRTVGEAPLLARDLDGIAGALQRKLETTPGFREPEDDDAARGLAYDLLASSMVLALDRAGQPLRTGPGEPIRVGDFAPFLELGEIASGEANAEPLVERLRAAGVADAPLVEPAAAEERFTRDEAREAVGGD